jgi:hypothetical protein
VKKKYQRQRRVESKAILDEIQGRMKKGETISIQEIMDQYLVIKTGNPLQYMLGKVKAKNLLCNSIKLRMIKEGINYGAVEPGRWGIVNTPSQANHLMTSYYKKTKGLIVGATRVAKLSQRDNLIDKPKNEKLNLPQPEDGI